VNTANNLPDPPFSGYQWGNPEVWCSFVPDGTQEYMGSKSNLHALYSTKYAEVDWKNEMRRALACWQSHCGLKFREVSDSGDPVGCPGLVQHDPRFGDIRIDASTGQTGLGSKWRGEEHGAFPARTPTSTVGGTLTLNGSGPAFINQHGGWGFPAGTIFDGNPDLFSLVLHELGAVLGLSEGAPYLSVMNGPGPFDDLYPGDIAAIQRLYGAGPPPPPPPDPLAKPVITAPSFVPSGALAVTISWLPVVGADHYEARLYNVTMAVWRFGSAAGGVPKTATTVTTGQLAIQYAFQFSVRAVGKLGNYSDWTVLNLKPGHWGG
jgi:hypothetical protein